MVLFLLLSWVRLAKIKKTDDINSWSGDGKQTFPHTSLWLIFSMVVKVNNSYPTTNHHELHPLPQLHGPLPWDLDLRIQQLKGYLQDPAPC